MFKLWLLEYLLYLFSFERSQTVEAIAFQGTHSSRERHKTKAGVLLTILLYYYHNGMFYFFRLEAWKFEKEMSLETCAAFKQKYSNAGRTKKLDYLICWVFKNCFVWSFEIFIFPKLQPLMDNFPLIFFNSNISLILNESSYWNVRH